MAGATAVVVAEDAVSKGGGPALLLLRTCLASGSSLFPYKKDASESVALGNGMGIVGL